MEKGEKLSEAKGAEQTNRKNAKIMKEKGLDFDLIAAITGFLLTR